MRRSNTALIVFAISLFIFGGLVGRWVERKATIAINTTNCTQCLNDCIEKEYIKISPLVIDSIQIKQKNGEEAKSDSTRTANSKTSNGSK